MDARQDENRSADSFETAFDKGADTLADKIVGALADRMVQRVMDDGATAPGVFKSLLRQVKSWLGFGCPQGC